MRHGLKQIGAFASADCLRSFSCVCVWRRPFLQTNTLARKFYRYGLRNALVDYASGDVYCKQSVVNHRGSCRETKLTIVSLLGLRYALGKKSYQLCVGCSDVMVPDSQVGGSCSFNDDGMLCPSCTASRALAEPGKVLALERQCVCCVHVTTTNLSTYVYPFGLCLCRHHHSTWMAKAITVQEATLHCKEDARKAIVDIFVAYREYKRKRAQPGINRRMKASKQRNRSRKA
jgi:hypothetical protein